MFGIVLAILFAALMGVASVFSSRGLENGSFAALLVVSLAVGSPVFLALTAVTTGFHDVPVEGVLYTATGAVVGSVVGRSLYFLGIGHLGPGKSLSINAASPLFAALLAWVVLGEEVTSLVVVGTLGIVLGIVVLSRDVRTQTERQDSSPLVVLYPLSSAALAAIAVTLRKLGLEAGIAPVQAGTVNMVVGLLVVAPIVATRWRSDLLETDRTSLWNFAAASVVMAVGFVCYFFGLRLTNASVFFPLIQTQPFFAVLLSAVFLRDLEVITRWTALGATVLVGGAILVVVG